jgi:hypothetical protein
MRGRRTALAVALVAAMVAGTGRAQTQASLELGDLRAVPSRGSALVFQLPIVWQASAPLGMPTVVVRRPSNALFFVANQTLELRLLELADVELEVSHAGQTVNRLLLKTELETARARMLSSIRRDHDQPAKAGDVKRAGPPRSSMAALERQMVGIRGEIQQLVDHVATLADMAKRAGVERHPEQWTFSWVLAVMVGGLLVAGLVSLLTSHVMRLRGLSAVIDRVRDALLTARLGLPALPPAQPRALERVTPREPTIAVPRQVRVSYKASRRIFLQGSVDQETSVHLMPLPCASMGPPAASRAVPATTDLEATRANLWQELITAQKRYLGFPDRQRTENHDRLYIAASTHAKASKADIQL